MPVGLFPVHRDTVKSDTVSDVCSVQLRPQPVKQTPATQIKWKLFSLSQTIRPAFCQSKGFRLIQTCRGSTSSHSIGDTMRQFMDKNRVVKRSISVRLSGIYGESARQNQSSLVSISPSLCSKETGSIRHFGHYKNSQKDFKRGMTDLTHSGGVWNPASFMPRLSCTDTNTRSRALPPFPKFSY